MPMEMQNTVENQLAHTLTQTEFDADYDKTAKKLLANKQILAQIMKGCVDEYSECSVDEIAEKYIEGTPEVGTVGVHVDDTNRLPRTLEVITGSNNEDSTLTEGTVHYDVRFDAIAPTSAHDAASQDVIRLIINVEAQKEEPGEDEILNPAIFYVSRLVSSQKERDFENSRYDDIKRVYSIWVCMNMDENTMSHIHLTKEDVIGSYEWKGNLDLINIVMIGLARELPEHDETYELHRLLGALLSQELSVDEKLNIIGNEYNIPIEENMRKDVSAMCNLGEGIEEKGIAIGREKGRIEGRIEGEAGLILKMYKNGLSAEQIASATDKPLEEVKEIIAGI